VHTLFSLSKWLCAPGTPSRDTSSSAHQDVKPKQQEAATLLALFVAEFLNGILVSNAEMLPVKQTSKRDADVPPVSQVFSSNIVTRLHHNIYTQRKCIVLILITCSKCYLNIFYHGEFFFSPSKCRTYKVDTVHKYLLVCGLTQTVHIQICLVIIVIFFLFQL